MLPDERSDCEAADSPGGGRSESPSSGPHPGAGRDQSRAAQPASEASAPLTGAPRRDNADLAAAAEADCRRGGPGGGREDEPESAPPRQRRRSPVRCVKVFLTPDAMAEVERQVLASGLSRTTFLGSSLIVGVRMVSRMLRADVCLIQGVEPGGPASSGQPGAASSRSAAV